MVLADRSRAVIPFLALVGSAVASSNIHGDRHGGLVPWADRERPTEGLYPADRLGHIREASWQARGGDHVEQDRWR